MTEMVSFPYRLLTPAMALLGIIFLAPFVYLLWLSLTNTSLATTGLSGEYIGLLNYQRAFSANSDFYACLERTLIYSLLCVVPQMLAGLAASELLHGTSRSKLRNTLVPILLLPGLLPPVVVGLYWKLLLQGEFGVLSYYLDCIGLNAAKSILSSPRSILPTIALVDFWQWFPFMLLVLLAARGAVPTSPTEAAWVDGASKYRTYFEIILPAMLPAVILLGLIRFFDSMRDFDKVYVMTGGGPGSSTELLSLHIWRAAFKSWEFGYAAAVSVLVYLAIFVLSFAVLRSRITRLL
jgi:multiple sugar transport system permease protein